MSDILMKNYKCGKEIWDTMKVKIKTKEAKKKRSLNIGMFMQAIQICGIQKIPISVQWCYTVKTALV